jgi:hypothetical protein
MAIMRVISAICLIALATLLVAEFSLFTEANYSPAIPYITYDSPRNYEVYNTNQPRVNITIEEIFDTGKSREAYYSLDGQKNVSIPLVYKGSTKDNQTGFISSIVSGTTILPKLSNGTHTIQFFAKYYGAEWGKSKVITFSVSDSEGNLLYLYFAATLAIVALVVIFLVVLKRTYSNLQKS